jgi:hypothetical protein
MTKAKYTLKQLLGNSVLYAYMLECDPDQITYAWEDAEANGVIADTAEGDEAYEWYCATIGS